MSIVVDSQCHACEKFGDMVVTRGTMKRRIVQNTIAKLTPPKAGNAITWDSSLPGFGVRITSTGVVAFVLDYRIHGRQRSYTIGRHPDLTATAARERALELRRGILDGKDPLEEKQQGDSDPTMGELATQYLERYAVVHKRARSMGEDRRLIEAIIRPKIGALRLKAVGKRDIEGLHASLKATPYQANRVLALLSKMFSLATEWGWRPENPARGVPRFHEDRREEWLQAEALQRFTQALDAYADQSAADALRLLLLTGARASEVTKSEWPQFDLNRGIWEKPSHHTKQKRIEHTPLSEPAITLLRRMRPKNASGLLFPDADGRPRVTLRWHWIQVCKAAGLVTAHVRKSKRGTITRYQPTVRINDLRHSYASYLVSSGVSLHIVGRLLGHTQPQTTMRYAHLQDEALRDATNRFGAIFGAATGGKPEP
jgi:integrase